MTYSDWLELIDFTSRLLFLFVSFMSGFVLGFILGFRNGSGE